MPAWGVASGQLLRHRAWQDEVVIYNDLSGDTHLLSADAWEVLTLLRPGTLPFAELASRLDLEGDAACSDLHQMLGSLHDLGLITAQ